MYPLQVLRACAALLVVLYHVRAYLIVTANDTDTFFRFFGALYGGGGVVMFFTISGFLMAYLIDSGYENFLLRRVLRIYPAYLVFAVAAVLFKFAFIPAFSINPLQTLMNMSLLPLGHNNSYPINVEWTLIYEIFFYVVCSFFANDRLKQYYPHFLVSWLVLILISNYLLHASSDLLPTYRTIATSMFNGYFISGSLAYYAYLRTRSVRDTVSVSIAVVSVAIIIALGRGHGEHALVGRSPSPLLMLCFALIIFAAAKLRAGAMLSGDSFVVKLGDYSYGLYLVHVPVIFIMLTCIHEHLGLRAGAGIGLLVLAVVLVCGWYAGKADMWLHEALKNRFRTVSTLLKHTCLAAAVVFAAVICVGLVLNIRSLVVTAGII